MKKGFFNFEVTLTWSKIMALYVATQAFTIDVLNGLDGKVFMFALPFVVALITGKQIIDKK